MLKTSARLCNAFPIFWYSLGSAESGKRMRKRGETKAKTNMGKWDWICSISKTWWSRCQNQLPFTFSLVTHLQSYSLPPPLLHMLQNWIKQLQSGFLKGTNSWGNSVWMLFLKKWNLIAFLAQSSYAYSEIFFPLPLMGEEEGEVLQCDIKNRSHYILREKIVIQTHNT